jgi:TatD DNase family protein
LNFDKLFDTHCHLDIDTALDDNLNDSITISKSIYRQLTHNICVASLDFQNLKAILKIKLNYDKLYCLSISESKDLILDKDDLENNLNRTNNKLYIGAGIHPMYIKEEPSDVHNKLLDNEFKDFESFVIKNRLNVSFIGEIGLDKRIEQRIPLNLQEFVLNKQISLAKTLNKNVVLHCVGRYNSLIDMLKKYKSDVKGIVHGFTSSYEVAKTLIDLGYKIGVGKHLFDSPKLQDVVKKVGLENLVVETDDFYSCKVNDGKDFVMKQAELINRVNLLSSLLNHDTDMCLEQIYHNSKIIFK